MAGLIPRLWGVCSRHKTFRPNHFFYFWVSLFPA